MNISEVAHFKKLAEIHGCKESLEDCNRKSCQRFYVCTRLVDAFSTLETEKDEKLEFQRNHLMMSIKELEAEVKRLRDGVQKVLDTQTMLTAVHAADECYKIAKELLTPTKTVKEEL